MENNQEQNHPIKVILTGHTGGLGKALCSVCLAQGYEVLGLARRSLSEVSGSLKQVAVNLSDSLAVQQMLNQSALHDFIADAQTVWLINNAGSVEPNALAGSGSLEAIKQTLALNVTAPIMLTNWLLAQKSAAQHVRIAHLSSGAGRKAYPGWSVYGASKAALDHHALCVQAENQENVRIASIAPGVVDTEMQRSIRAADADLFPLRQRFVSLHESGSLSTPISVAQAIVRYTAAEDFGKKVIQDVRDWDIFATH